MWGGALSPVEVASLTNFVGDGQPSSASIDGPNSLIDVHGEHFVSYNSKRKSLCVGLVSQLIASSAKEQLPVVEELGLTLDPYFLISHISCSDHYCLLWGARGILIATLEHRNFEPNFELTAEKFIAEKVYREHPTLSIFQCKWSPIPTGKLIMVLNSDSFLRIYNVETGQNLGCFNFGPHASLPLVTTFSVDIHPETPIDFDFGPFVSYIKSWMVLVLKPTGQVYCALLGIVGSHAQCFVNSYRRVKYYNRVEEEEDNYSRILCSKQFPVVCITSQTCGQLSHSIMIPIRLETDNLEVEEDVDKHLMNDSYRLFVKERLKLQSRTFLGISLHLQQDPVFDNRYICVHGSGIHLITIKFLPEVQKFLQGNEDALDSLSSSVCRNLIIWNVGGKSPSTNKLFGACFIVSQPERLLCVLRDSRSIFYPMPHPSDILKLEEKMDAASSNAGGGDTRNVLEVIKSTLSQSSEQPFYCCEQEAGQTWSRELLQTILKSKFERLSSLEKAVKYLTAHLKTMRSESKALKISVQSLLETRVEVKDAAQNIAEIFEELSEEDEVIKKRMDVVMYRFHQTFPVLTDKEKEWRQKLESISRDTASLKLSTGDLKLKAVEMKDALPNKTTTLKSHQLEAIKEEVMHNQFIISTMKNSLLQITQDKLARQ